MGAAVWQITQAGVQGHGPTAVKNPYSLKIVY